MRCASPKNWSRAKASTCSTGTFLSNIGLAVTDFAGKKKVFFLAAEPLTDKITWQNGNRYTFRLRPSTYMQAAMLVPEAVAAKKKRWALVYPNYEYGQSAAATFKELLKAAQPDVEFVTEQAPPLGKIDAGAVVQALDDAKPDAIFNVLFGADLAKFVREGNTRGLFKDRTVVSLLTGEPEYLDPLKDEAPVGWIVTGYPWDEIETPEHKAFLAAYQKRWNDYPRLGSVVGYATIKSIAAGIAKAGSTDTEKLIAAFRGLKVDGAVRPRSTYRASDHQATMGAYVGKIALKDGKGAMVDFKYVDGADVLPTDAEVKKLRPAAMSRAIAARVPSHDVEPLTAVAVARSRTRLPRCGDRCASLALSDAAMTFDALLFQALNGLAARVALFLVGAGLSLIFGVTRIVNFAHGSLYMLGIYIAYTLATKVGGGIGFWGGMLARGAGRRRASAR